MPQRIAHLSALRAFAVVADCLSFKRAAEQLGTSPSAVSHQIRTLEEYLGEKLFVRRARSIELTAAGRTLHPPLREGFDLIGTALRETRALTEETRLRISAGPSIAAKWLLPRLHRFHDLYPAINVEVGTTNEVVDLLAGHSDLALRHGRGDYPDHKITYLLGEAYVPLCAPGYVPAGAPVQHLTELRLLHDDAATYPGQSSGWADWFSKVGLDPGLAEKGQHFAQTDHALQAAMSGAGILLGRRTIASDDIASGRLVVPWDMVLPSPFSYFLVCAERRCRERPIKAFTEWIVGEAKSADLGAD